MSHKQAKRIRKSMNYRNQSMAGSVGVNVYADSMGRRCVVHTWTPSESRRMYQSLKRAQ